MKRQTSVDTFLVPRATLARRAAGRGAAEPAAPVSVVNATDMTARLRPRREEEKEAEDSRRDIRREKRGRPERSEPERLVKERSAAPRSKEKRRATDLDEVTVRAHATRAVMQTEAEDDDGAASTAARVPGLSRPCARDAAATPVALAEESTDPWDAQAARASGLSPVAEAWLVNERRTVPHSWVAVKGHKEVDSKMRATLADWLFEVVEQYHLSRKALALATNYVDRFLAHDSAKPTIKLLGAAALWVASKFEDLTPVDLGALVWISDNAFKAADVVVMERTILEALHYDVAHQPCVVFLDALLEGMGAAATPPLRHLCAFLCDAAAESWNLLASALPSQLAAALLHHCAAYLGLDPARTVAPLLALPPLALNVTAPQWPVLLRGVQQFHAQVYKSHSLYGAVKQRYALPDRDAVATLDPLRGDFVFSPG